MKINAEFSFYPFGISEFKPIVKDVIKDLTKTNLHITYTPVSTILFGESEQILDVIDKIIDKYFTKYKVVLDVKLSNACPEPE